MYSWPFGFTFFFRTALRSYDVRETADDALTMVMILNFDSPPGRRYSSQQRYFMRTRVREFEMHLRSNVLVLLLYLNTRYQVYSTRYQVHIWGGLAVAPDADHPTRTLTRTRTRTRTLWGDLCLDAVACEGSRLIRPKGDAEDEGCSFQMSRTRVYIQLFRPSAVHVQPSQACVFTPRLHHTTGYIIQQI